LRVPFGLSFGSFLVGATLIVDSSSLGTMAGAVSIASIAREGAIPLLLLADAAMVVPMGDGDGSWLMMEGQPSTEIRMS
jgi:translation initiation factor 2B subunit (eIF-2B alpha/beta/delta family)